MISILLQNSPQISYFIWNVGIGNPTLLDLNIGLITVRADFGACKLNWISSHFTCCSKYHLERFDVGGLERFDVGGLGNAHSKNGKVLLNEDVFKDKPYLWRHSSNEKETIATRCINDFAINEKDQLEIAAVIAISDNDTHKSGARKAFQDRLDKAIEAVKNHKKQQGLDFSNF